MENFEFIANYSGEFGIGEITGANLESFKELFKSKSLGDSDFVDEPWDYAEHYATGLMMLEDDLPGWGIPNSSLDSEGSTIGFPKNGDDYKPGVYFIFTNLSERYSVELELDTASQVQFVGSEIDIQYLEPDMEAGDLNGLVLAQTVNNGDEEIYLVDHMTDLDGLRQSIMVVEVKEDNEVVELYVNRLGDEDYYDWE
jgi:hypothetical protein